MKLTRAKCLRPLDNPNSDMIWKNTMIVPQQPEQKLEFHKKKKVYSFPFKRNESIKL